MFKNIKIIAFLLLSFVEVNFAQVQMTGNLADRVNSFIIGLPSGAGTDEYQTPSSTQLTSWGNAILKIIQGQYSAANDTAASIGYRVLEFTDNGTAPNKLFYVLEKMASSTNHWGMFIYSPSALRSKLFIQSPHPKFDLKTGQQGFYVFKNVGARAYFTSGTHRCNSSLYSACSGTTDVCGTDENFRKSDQPHNVDGTLQKATEILKNNISSLVIIQNHGFSKGTGDPDVIMGNGTTSAPSGTDYLVNLKNNLFAIDNTLTFKVAHVDLGWTTNIGTTNTQGRLLNGSASPCNQNVSIPNGRFLHIEQAYAKLRDTQANWDKLSGATATTLPISLTLTSPNGGETLSGNSSQTITWTSTGDISNVKLEYSVDNGQNWLSITSNTSNTGSYVWTVPKVGSWRARVRVSAVYDSTVNDVSNNKFTINFTVWPISDTENPDLVASPFGSRLLSGVYDFHRGIDLPNNLNTPIHPVAKGIVVRFEDTSQTIGTTRERYGNWILVQHQSVSGEPRHTAYLHLNSFNGYNVGDSVSTLDTIGFMGKSGVGINTIHTHLELEENLSGTSMDKDKAFNPLEILNYNNTNNYLFAIIKRNDSTGCQFSTPSTELDFDKITIYGRLATKIIGFNQRIGINPDDNDNPRYNSVYIDPVSFTKDSTIMRYKFWTKDIEVGTIDSFKIEDIEGFATTYSTQLMRYAVINGNWDSAIWATTSSGIPGSAAVPDSLNDVMINSGITVTVNVSGLKCNAVNFANETSKLAFNSSGVLNVYGNFNLASVTHTAFSSWSAGGRIKFVGNNQQVINNLSTSTTTTTQTTFMEVQVEKSGDTLKIPKGDFKFNIGTSLDIIKGVFFIDSTSDIQGRNIDGSGATTPTITVQSGGIFSMAGGASHIGSGTTGTPRPAIGKITILGTMILATTSTNKINFGNIDVENGGTLNIPSGQSSEKINPGTVTVKSGATFITSSITDYWALGTTLDLKIGGFYKTTASATVFPPNFINNGTVRYQRTASGDQTITDMNYYRLEISYSGNSKVWTLSSGRTVSDSLEINNNTTLVINSTTPKSININGTLCLASGTLNNSANANLALSNGATISRAEGSIMSSPLFNQSVNVIYNSTVSDMLTGLELPTGSTTLNNLTLASPKVITLNSDIVVNGNLTFTYNKLVTGIHCITVKNQTIGAGKNKFVEGKLFIPAYSPGYLKWEIGQANTYMPVTIGINSINGRDSLSIIVLDRTVDTIVGPINPSSTVLRRYFRIEKGSGINSITFDSLILSYSDQDVIEQGLNETELFAYYFEGSIWKKAHSVYRDTLTNHITISAIHLPTELVISGSDLRNLISREINVVSGWNLLSVPLEIDDMRKEVLFPTSISPAYAFRGAYVRADTLQNGIGYWLKFGIMDTVTFYGLENGNNTIPVYTGWNLVGVFNYEVPVSTITSTPDNILASAFFGYQNGYTQAATLMVGRGYWIKVNQNGVLNIPIVQAVINMNNDLRMKRK